MCLANTPCCVVLTSAKNSKASQRKLQHADLRCGLRQFTSVRIRPNPSESVRIHPYRSYRNPLTISSAGRLRSTEAVIWRVRRTGIVSANSTDLPCLNFEPDDLDISPVIRCLLYFILFYYDPPIPLEMLLFPGL